MSAGSEPCQGPSFNTFSITCSIKECPSRRIRSTRLEILSHQVRKSVPAADAATTAIIDEGSILNPLAINGQDSNLLQSDYPSLRDLKSCQVCEPVPAAEVAWPGQPREGEVVAQHARQLSLCHEDHRQGPAPQEALWVQGSHE